MIRLDLWIILGLLSISLKFVSSYLQAPYSLCYDSDDCYLLSNRPLVWANSYYDEVSPEETYSENPIPVEDVTLERILDWNVGLKVKLPYKPLMAQANPWPGGWSDDDDEEDEEEDEEDEEEDKAVTATSSPPVTYAASNVTTAVAAAPANATKVSDGEDESDEEEESSEEEEFEGQRLLSVKERAGPGLRQPQRVKGHDEAEQYDDEEPEDLTPEERLLLLKKKILVKKAILGKAVFLKKKKIFAKKAALLAKKSSILRGKKKYVKKKYWKKKIIKAAVAGHLFSKSKTKPTEIPMKKKKKKKNPRPTSIESNVNLNSADAVEIENVDDELEENSVDSTVISADKDSQSTPTKLGASDSSSPQTYSTTDDDNATKQKVKGKKKGLKKYSARPVNLGIQAELYNRFSQVTNSVQQLYSAFRSEEDTFQEEDGPFRYSVEFPHNYYPVNKETEWKRFYPVTLRVVYQIPTT